MSSREDDHAGPAEQPLSSREWLARVRENGLVESTAAPVPERPSRRFTWGVRVAIVLAAVFYGGLAVWSRLDAERDLPAPAAVLLGLAAVVAVVALLDAWRWAARPRFGTSPAGPLDADLSPEAKKTVHRMARGRGPEVPELRPRAAAYAWAQQQSTGPFPAFLAIVNLSNVSQSTGTVVGLVLGTVLLLLTVGGLGWTLWTGHRARVLGVRLPHRGRGRR